MASRNKVAYYSFLLTIFPIAIAISIGFLIIIVPPFYGIITNTNTFESCDYSSSLFCAMFYDIMPMIVIVLMVISGIPSLILFITTIADALKTKRYLWAVFIFLSPILSLIYYLLNMKECPDKSQS